MCCKYGGSDAGVRCVAWNGGIDAGVRCVAKIKVGAILYGCLLRSPY